jgi:hypothetical protein
MSNQETIEKLWDNKDQIDFIKDQKQKILFLMHSTN